MYTSCPPQARLDPLIAWLATHAPQLGLTGYSSTEQVRDQAVFPALALQALLGGPPIGPWADFGAGSGALGLALATLHPTMHVTLVDRRQKATDFIELSTRRLRLSNASSLNADIHASIGAPAFAGVCLRAVSVTSEALAGAASNAIHYVCAWHSPGAVGYDADPPGFRLAARTAALAPNLVASLYARGYPVGAHRSPA